MTARIDLAKLEQMLAQRASDQKCIMEAQWCDDYRDSARARDRLAEADNAMRNALPALIAAVRALREAEELIADMLPYCMEGWDWKYGQYWNDEHAKVRAALAAFDFKEETK